MHRDLMEYCYWHLCEDEGVRKREVPCPYMDKRQMGDDIYCCHISALVTIGKSNSVCEPLYWNETWLDEKWQW